MPVLRKTWTDFFAEKNEESGLFRTLSKKSIDPFNAATRRHLDSAECLLTSLVSRRYNFFLIARSGRNVQLIHSAILFSPSFGNDPIIMLGIQGNRVTSPLRVIPEDAVIKGIRKSG
jgi:hypothetical protein